jgi:hypothetical protein
MGRWRGEIKRMCVIGFINTFDSQSYDSTLLRLVA